MKRYAVFLAVAAVIAGISGVAVADSGPLADAGLDQEVSVNTTVQLDGTGSTHPDGRIDGYEWSIETPDGRLIVPDCPDCARTRFTPRRSGRYDVTVTVTDEEGRSDSDTLYVYVNGTGLTVNLTGDTEPRTGNPTSYTATVNSTDAELERITWRVDNRTVETESLDGSEDRSERTFVFTDSSPRRIEVTATDSENRTGSDFLVVNPRPGRADPPESSGPVTDFDGPRPRTTDPEGSDCINGVYVDTDSGCIGHISDATHSEQEEGCERDFCGVENPARETDTGNVVPEDDPDNEPGYKFKKNEINKKTELNNNSGYINPR